MQNEKEKYNESKNKVKYGANRSEIKKIARDVQKGIEK